MTAGAYDGPVVNHLGQATVDLDRAIAFYVGVFGFAVERRMTFPDEPTSTLLGVEPPLGLEVAYLRRGSFTLELMRFDREGNPPWRERTFTEPGLTHLSISVVALGASKDAVVAHGGTVVRDLPYATIVRDPDGQIIELLPMEYRKRTDDELAALAAAKEPAVDEVER